MPWASEGWCRNLDAMVRVQIGLKLEAPRPRVENLELERLQIAVRESAIRGRW